MKKGEKPPMHLRHELKYTVSQGDAWALSAKLGKLFERDGHTGAQGFYQVCSLYFDSSDDRALRQKLAGVDRREKFRLRYYGDETDRVKLEKKMKLRGLCAKYSAELTGQQAQDLILGRGEVFLRDGSQQLLTEFYSKRIGGMLLPKTVVCYEREAFVYRPGNVRVTIDRNLRTMMDPRKFLSQNKSWTDVVEGNVVVEVKYDAFLPEIVRMAVQLPDSQAVSFSKYARCRRIP